MSKPLTGLWLVQMSMFIVDPVYPVHGHVGLEEIYVQAYILTIPTIVSGITFVFQGCPTMQRLAAVNGLVALVGSENYLIQVRNPLFCWDQRLGRKGSEDVSQLISTKVKINHKKMYSHDTGLMTFCILQIVCKNLSS